MTYEAIEEIDTSTTEGFVEALDRLNLSTLRASLVLGTTESTIKNYRKGARPVHPTMAIMLDWLLDGYRPDNWYTTGEEFRARREALGLDQEQLADLFDAEIETIEKWENNAAGPPSFVVVALGWLEDGYRPAEWADFVGDD